MVMFFKNLLGSPLRMNIYLHGPILIDSCPHQSHIQYIGIDATLRDERPTSVTRTEQRYMHLHALSPALTLQRG